MTELSPAARAYFATMASHAGTAGATGGVIDLLAGDDIDPFACADLAERLGASNERWYRRDCLDLVLGYLRKTLEEGTLHGEVLRDIAIMKGRLQIRPGEFATHRLPEVSRVLVEQFELLLEDGRIDREEDLYQVELQSVFDLGYDEYLSLIRGTLEYHWISGHQRVAQFRAGNPAEATRLTRELTAIEPLYRLALGKPRQSELSS